MATVWDGRTLQKCLVQLRDFWKSLHQRLSQKNLKADAAIVTGRLSQAVTKANRVCEAGAKRAKRNIRFKLDKLH
ncbi:hypothetical protein H109_06411 [Trichophyton interdigitale MR816]|uniref:Uncharacterized protein n=1 Tax=Trichophyton interdigitale (strain MR816) TaxID=1215338 RepID=A0A059J1E9_TRIIM|nr:hypothetical protein H109_06411 [Trichophyton interdigitale MR816]